MLNVIKNQSWRVEFDLYSNVLGVSFRKYGEEGWNFNLYEVDSDFPFVLVVENVYYLRYSPNSFRSLRGFLRNFYSILRGKGRIDPGPRSCTSSNFKQSQQDQRNYLQDGPQAETILTTAQKIQVLEDLTKWAGAKDPSPTYFAILQGFVDRYKSFLLK